MRGVLLALLVVACGETEPNATPWPGPYEPAAGNGGGAAAGSAGASGAGGGETSAAGSAVTEGGKAPTGGGGSTGSDVGGESTQAGSPAGGSGGGSGAPQGGGGASAGGSPQGGSSSGAGGSDPGPVECDCYEQTGNQRVFCVAFDNAKGFACVECGANNIDCDGDTVEPDIGSGCEVAAQFCPI
jgi:hypothetical protein